MNVRVRIYMDYREADLLLETSWFSPQLSRDLEGGYSALADLIDTNKYPAFATLNPDRPAIVPFEWKNQDTLP
jgi:hypothetical protein